MNIRRRLFKMAAASALVLGLASAVEAQGRRGGNNNGNNGTHGNNGTPGNNGAFAAPELSPASATAAIALLSGGILVFSVRRIRRRSDK